MPGGELHVLALARSGDVGKVLLLQAFLPEDVVEALSRQIHRRAPANALDALRQPLFVLEEDRLDSPRADVDPRCVGHAASRCSTALPSSMAARHAKVAPP